MYLLAPKSKNEVYELKEYYDGLILSLENLSINYPEFTLEEIKDLYIFKRTILSSTSVI